ncbi:MAG: hypothetical protein Q8P56_06215, partial [Candidatus Uhrbacteria bacterium]|nr:hypothetical protein [Candidatus Uhrbacteria bacterium]
IGGGNFGDTYVADVEIGKRTRKFVIKKFKEFNNLSPQDHALRAMENYNAAKEAKLKVFPTYRLSEDKESILMTSADLEKNYCVDRREEIKEGELGIERIRQFEDLVTAVLSEAIKAGKASVAVYMSAYFFLVDRKTKTRVDFVIGDLDDVKKDTDTPVSEIIQSNLDFARMALIAFLNNNVEDFQKYARRLQQIYDTMKK